MPQFDLADPLRGKAYGEFSAAVRSRSFHEEKFIKAQIELTYACNLHCVHCYTDPYNKPEFLSREWKKDDVLAALDALYRAQILWLCFTGGEIFARKNFLEIYDYAHRRGFLLTLFTNGTLVTDAVADHLACKPPFSLEITLYGATAETYEKVTQVKGSYKRCLEGIERLIERKLPLKLKTSALTVNQHEIGAMKKMAESWGVSFKVSSLIYPRLDGDTSVCNLRLPAGDIVRMECGETDLAAARCALSEEEIFLSSPNDSIGDPETRFPLKTSGNDKPFTNSPNRAQAPPNLYRCGCGHLDVHLDPYGGAGACTWQRKYRRHFQSAPIQEIMSELAKTLRAQVYSSESPCRHCEAFSYCDKNPEMAVYETGSADKAVAHFCDVAFTRRDKKGHSISDPRPADQGDDTLKV